MKHDGGRAWRANDDVDVPVARPMLPNADALLPYLREIDRGRRYANHGPLVRRFEARLAERLGAPEKTPSRCCRAARRHWR